MPKPRELVHVCSQIPMTTPKRSERDVRLQAPVETLEFSGSHWGRRGDQPQLYVRHLLFLSRERIRRACPKIKLLVLHISTLQWGFRRCLWCSVACAAPGASAIQLRPVTQSRCWQRAPCLCQNAHSPDPWLP